MRRLFLLLTLALAAFISAEAQKTYAPVAATDTSTLVTKTTTVNGHALSSNVTVDKSDVGLSAVENTADSAKPVSTAQQAALDLKVPTSRTVAGHALTSDVAISKGDVGLGNVDNTSDLNKGVSTAQQTALDLKANTTDVLLLPIVTNISPATGDTVSASTGKRDETLYLTPSGSLLALTVVLPSAANSRVGQIIRVFISQIITGLTVNVSGTGTLIGSLPITSAVNSTFAYQCVSTSGAGTWIRIQ